MRNSLAAACVLAIGVAAFGADEAAKIVKQDDGGFAVTGKNYTAKVDAVGDLLSLKIEGVEVLNSTAPNKGAAFPGDQPAESVTLEGSTVKAVRGKIRVEYTFGATGIDVLTEGGTVYPRLQGQTAAVCIRGVTAGPKQAVGDVRKMVFGKVAFGVDKSFHHMNGGLTPSQLCGRGGKPEDKFTYHVECGVAVEPQELLTALELACRGQDPFKCPYLAKGDTPVFEVTADNLGVEPVAGEVRLLLTDQIAGSEPVWQQTLPVEVAGGQKLKVESKPVEVPAPGCYWMTAEFALSADAKAIKSETLGFVYDANSFTHPLTRPADFREFWDKKITDMRKIPFDAKLTEDSKGSNDTYVMYDLDIAGADGKRIQTYLRVPRREGKYLAEVDSYWGSTPLERVKANSAAKYDKQPAGFGQWERGGSPRVRVGAPQPADSTYTRWVSRDDNNMLDSYLLTLRMADYLRSRKDVAGILIFGASRSGAIAVAVGALDPDKIIAIDAHVPTSCGLSWTDKAYRGWGSRFKPEVTAYFDVVNFAPDIKAPLIVDGGIYDGLSPAMGILALINSATNSPLVRGRIERGGHGYFSKPSRPQMTKELNAYLKDKVQPQP